MKDVKLCLGVSSQFGIGTKEQISLFKQIGFDGFFVQWNCGTDLQELRQHADFEGMTFHSVHAPFLKAADMWQNSTAAREAIGELLECAVQCSSAGVPIMVCHTFIGFEDHSPTSFGIANYKTVAERAKELGVKIAFENTEGEEYLAALMEAFNGDDNVGYCWDTGHELCYNHGKDMLSPYGNRLLCTHLNDNLGIKAFDGTITWHDDLHLLPFDGIADWTDVAHRLNACGYNDFLTFELNTKSKPNRCENDVYDRMNIEDYICEAYKRACRVAAIKENLKHKRRM